MAEDIALLKKASGFLNFATGTGELIDFRKVIDELWETSKEEMDFEKKHNIWNDFMRTRRTLHM